MQMTIKLHAGCKSSVNPNKTTPSLTKGLKASALLNLNIESKVCYNFKYNFSLKHRMFAQDFNWQRNPQRIQSNHFVHSSLGRARQKNWNSVHVFNLKQFCKH